MPGSRMLDVKVPSSNTPVQPFPNSGRALKLEPRSPGWGEALRSSRFLRHHESLSLMELMGRLRLERGKAQNWDHVASRCQETAFGEILGRGWRVDYFGGHP